MFLLPSLPLAITAAADGQRVGVMGQADAGLTGPRGVDQPVFVAEINAGSILAAPVRGE